MAVQFIKVDIETAATRFDLNKLQKEQIPFATALALTRTAQDAQRFIKDDMPRRFTIRRKFVLKGVKIVPAKKRDIINFGLASSEVFSKDRFMWIHEPGGVKKAPSGKKHLAIPSPLIRTSKNRVVPKSRYVAKVLQNKKKFFIDMDRKNRPAVFKRVTKNKTKVAFWLRPQVKIKPRWNFGKTAARAVRLKFVKNFNAAMRKALATAR